MIKSKFSYLGNHFQQDSELELFQCFLQFFRTEEFYQSELKSRLIGEFTDKKKSEQDRTNDAEKYIRWIQGSLTKPHLITIFEAEGDEISMESGKDLDSAILMAIFKAKGGQRFPKLKLALAWNLIDMAQEFLFHAKIDQKNETKLGHKEFAEVMPDALLKDRIEFVKEFVKRGLRLREFLTDGQLVALYTEVVLNFLFKILEHLLRITYK